jgi:hypothetical protein
MMRIEGAVFHSSLAELYTVTGDRHHLEAAELFNRLWFVAPLAKGEDRLPGLHGNTHVAQAVGLAHCANLTGDTNEIKASENFWSIVSREHSFVIGGDTFGEWFDKPGVETGPCIDGQYELPPTTAESCNAHNMLNLKGVGGRYNSFQNSPERLPFVERSLVKSTEAIIEPEIMAYSFQTETTIADLSTTGERQAQQKVCEVTGLKPGKHAIDIVNRGPGPVAVEALVLPNIER